MKQFSSAFAAMLLATSISPLSSAATVNYVLDLTGPAGTFAVRATASAGDNFGLSLYGVELTGPILTLDHVSTASISATDAAGQFGTTGFTLLRGVDVRDGGSYGLRGSQEIISPTPHVLYGLGQQSGSLNGLGLTTEGRSTSPSWESEFLIAIGVYDGDWEAMDIDLGGVTLANVLTSNSGTWNETANVTKEIRWRDPATGLTATTGPIGRPLPPPALPVSYDPLPPISPPAADPIPDPFVPEVPPVEANEQTSDEPAAHRHDDPIDPNHDESALTEAVDYDTVARAITVGFQEWFRTQMAVDISRAGIDAGFGAHALLEFNSTNGDGARTKLFGTQAGLVSTSMHFGAVENGLEGASLGSRAVPEPTALGIALAATGSAPLWRTRRIGQRRRKTSLRTGSHASNLQIS